MKHSNPNKELNKLIKKWLKEAKRLENKSSKTWKGLVLGNIDQIDEIIYSVYKDASASNYLYSCATELEDLIKGLK